MAEAKPTVVLGLLGTKLDSGRGRKRWTRWRPTVALAQQEDLHPTRIDLLHGPGSDQLSAFVAEDIQNEAPATLVRQWAIEVEDWWDFDEVFAALYEFADAYPFAPEEEDYLVHITTGTHVAQICWFLLVEARIVPGRLLQTAPGSDTAGTHQVIDLNLARYDHIAMRFAARRSEAVADLKSGIQTHNPAFNQMIDDLERVAATSRAPILLLGPTGAGKTALAKRIYALQKDRGLIEGPFVEVNCATLRGDAAMSALFGHERGAYTGADRRREGLLRAADGGMLFLDEIGELGLDEQAMLLRALEEGRFLPVGADKEVESRFSLIAGTNRDLPARVAEGRFRDDLLARIDLWTFRLPGLKDRPEDIEPNLDFELERLGAELGLRVSMNAEARAAFLAFAIGAPWPRNFRDLSASLTRMGTLAPGGRVDLPTVQAEITRLERAWQHHLVPEEASPHPTELPPSIGPIDRFDAAQLAEVLRVCADSPSLSEAGRRLFAESRKAKAKPNDADRLRKYLARHGLDFATAARLTAAP